jgi:chromosome segregation ATPase
MSPLQERMRNIQMRRHITVEEILQNRIDEQHEELRNRTAEIAQAFLGRQQAVEEVLEDLAEEMENINVLDAAQFQTANLSARIQELRQVQQTLQTQMTQAQQTLAEKRIQKHALQKELETFALVSRHKPKKNHGFEEPLNEQGKLLCQHISKNMS